MTQEEKARAYDEAIDKVAHFIKKHIGLGIDSDTYNKIVDECVYGEKTPAWSGEDKVKDNWEFIHEFVNKFGRIPKDEDELNVLVEYVLKRQKPTAWSEEDEEHINDIQESLLAYKIIVMDNDMELANYIEKEINFLESFRNRIKQ